MHREGQLDDSKVGSEVAAWVWHTCSMRNEPDLQAQLLELIGGQAPSGLVGYGLSSTVRTGRLTWA